MLYLDTLASYPMLEEVKESMKTAFEQLYGNPSSSHKAGELALDKVNNCREVIADCIGAFPSEIVFTSGATESNNLALKGLLLHKSYPQNKKHIVLSAIEHKCMFSIANYLAQQGFEISLAMPNDNGVVTLNEVQKHVKESTGLISIMHANNELGTINSVTEIGQYCFDNGILFHTDAAQSFMKLDIDVDELNVDALSISAHKIGGPKGIGAVYIRDLRTRNIEPVIHGAGQEEGLRGGTIPAPLIVGLNTAIEHFPNYYNRIREFRFLEKLKELLNSNHINFTINGVSGLQHAVSLTLPNVNVTKLIADNEDLCFSQGSACTSREIEASHVLTALGLSRSESENTFRISIDHTFNDVDLALLVSAIKRAS